MLVEALVNVSLTAQMNVLDLLGLSSKGSDQVLKWAKDRASMSLASLLH
jgi:hypothetical protein